MMTEICRKCYEDLQFENLEIRGNFVSEEYGLCEVYECVDCGEEHIYLVDEDKWSNDYVGEFGDVGIDEGY